MTNTERNHNNGVGRFRTPEFLTNLGDSRGPWYETADEIEAGLAWGTRKRFLLRRISHSMRGCLTSRERECIKLRFFRGFTLCEISRRLKMDTSSIHRALKAAIKKLRRFFKQPDHTLGVSGDVQVPCSKNTRKRRKAGRRPKRILKNRKKANQQRRGPAPIKRLSRRAKARDPRRKLTP